MRPVSPVGPAGGLRRYVEIVHLLAQREFLGRYRGNLLGAVTAVLVPVLFLATYTFVFSTLIPIRLWPDATRTDYAFFLFSGLVGWNLLVETTNGAASLFESRAHFVRRALFPVSALPVATAVTAFYHALIWLAVFVAARWALAGAVPATAVLAPLALVSVALLTVGVALIVASLGALIRDLSELVAPLLAVGFFLSPVLYPSERIASLSPWIVYANPMAPQLETLRAVLLDGTVPEGAILFAALAWAAGLLAAGVGLHLRVRSILPDLV